MFVLFLVLNKTEYLDEVLNSFVEIGVKGATVLDSQGMASALVSSDGEQNSSFGFFKNYLEASRPYNKTIFTVLESKELVVKVVNVVNEILGDINRPGKGLMFTIPIGEVYGL